MTEFRSKNNEIFLVKDDIEIHLSDLDILEMLNSLLERNRILSESLSSCEMKYNLIVQSILKGEKNGK